MNECILNEHNVECWLKYLNVKMYVILGFYYDFLYCHDLLYMNVPFLG